MPSICETSRRCMMKTLFLEQVDVKLKQFPVVVLKDCLRERNKRKLSADLEAARLLEESVDGLPTPSQSSGWGDSDESVAGKGKKRKSRKMEYHEVEKIVGYHVDSNNKIWYLLKWKGWKSKYNTFQTVEDMTNCNKLLMEYFEYKKPDPSELARVDSEIEESVSKSVFYKTLVETNFKKSDFLRIMSFPSGDFNLIFTDKYESAYKRLESEYEYIIRCLIGMCLHRDQQMFKRAVQYKIGLKLCKMREEQLKGLKEQEARINCLEKCLVRIINDKDLDLLPEGFKYITDVKPGNGVTIPNDPLVGCSCPEGCGPKSKCCGAMMGTGFVYTKHKKLKWPRVPIYECNIRCKCPPDCPNRVVQRGRNIPVAVFKTDHCGWGVKTLKEIEKGSFVCEYFGEVISETESVVRDIEYISRNTSYVFNLDFTPDREMKYCIDATRYGNLSRFINHSCDPNLIVCTVWINCLDPYMPRLAFFARRHIRKGEELSIDYESRVDCAPTETSDTAPRTITNVRCFCNKEKCREWLFGSL